MDFILLDKTNKLMFLALMRDVAKDIRKSIMHIFLSISIHKAKNLYTNKSEI